MSEIYDVPCQVLHASGLISAYIRQHIRNPLLIGPDEGSRQWVSEVAGSANAPFLILQKVRHGDELVYISVPRLGNYKDHTPVLVDDIISTAPTMIETVSHLKTAKIGSVVCIGIHAVFAGEAYKNLLDAGAAKVITCNSIPHQSNGIDISGLFQSIFNV